MPLTPYVVSCSVKLARLSDLGSSLDDWYSHSMKATRPYFPSFCISSMFPATMSVITVLCETVRLLVAVLS